MKINETIRQRRIERNLTQEQVANYLGVTAPAVNKWEKGTSYPDITTLPALARILETDLNTLLSFKEELTEQEIAIFLNTLSELLEKEGFLKVYEIAMEKIREYPVCYPLLLNVAMFLEGAGMYSKEGKKDLKIHKKEIEALYHRVLNSPGGRKTIFIHYRNSECFIDADGDCIKTRKKRRRRIFRRGVKAGGKII